MDRWVSVLNWITKADFMFKCRALDCDSWLTYFWKAGFYDFPAFGVGNKTTLETSPGLFSFERKVNQYKFCFIMFPEKPFEKNHLWASLKRYQHFNMRYLELKSLDAHMLKEREETKRKSTTSRNIKSSIQPWHLSNSNSNQNWPLSIIFIIIQCKYS